MSITAAEIVAYAALDRPQDESSTSGGGIDTSTRVVFVDISATDKVEVLSSAAGDNSQTIAVVGRLASGVLATDTISLNGTSVVSGALTFERIESATLSGTCAGNVTVRRLANAGNIGIIPIGELGFVRMFINSYSSPSGAKVYYEKLFIKNTDSTLSYLNAVIIGINFHLR